MSILELGRSSEVDRAGELSSISIFLYNAWCRRSNSLTTSLFTSFECSP